MSTLNVSEGLGRTPSRSTARYRGHGITDLDRAQPRQAIPLDDLKPLFKDFNEGVDKAKAAYYGTTKFYAARTAASQKQQRYRARKKAS